MTKEDYENFDNSSKCWLCDNVYVKVGLSPPKEFFLFASVKAL